MKRNIKVLFYEVLGMFYKTYFQTMTVYLFHVIILSHLLLFLNIPNVFEDASVEQVSMRCLFNIRYFSYIC